MLCKPVEEMDHEGERQVKKRVKEDKLAGSSDTWLGKQLEGMEVTDHKEA